MTRTGQRAVRAGALAGSLALVASGAVASNATAAPLVRERVYESWEFADECDGVAYTGAVEMWTNLQVVAAGRDRLAYYRSSLHVQTVYTNSETGRTYTNIRNGSDRDAAITDNGDGTLTIRVQTAGSDRWLDSRGKPFLKNTGVLAWELRVPHNGTPTDPFDDGEADFLGIVRELTGRADLVDREFCTDFLAVTG